MIPPALHPIRRRACAALSLIEVMIAMAIFFMAVFSILAMVSATLRNARALQNTQVDAPGALASFLSTSNRLDEGSYSGDFGDLYPDYEYTYDVVPITNSLVRVDMVIMGGQGRNPVESTLSIFLLPPSQPAGAQGMGGVPGMGLRR
jgi:hypothetical protein